MARLIVREGNQERQHVIKEQITTIGRSEDNTITISDELCSRHHCQIVKSDRGYKLVDLESKNGTRVNGTTVNQHILKAGDIIEIGSCRLIFDDSPAHMFSASPLQGSGASSARVMSPGVKPASPDVVESKRTQRTRVWSMKKRLWDMPVAVVVAVVITIVIVARLLTPSAELHSIEKANQLFAEGEKLMLVAREAFDRNDVARCEQHYLEAIEKFKAITPDVTRTYQRAQEQIALINDIIRNLRREAEEKVLEEEYRSLMKYIADHPEDVDEALRRCERFLNVYPTGPKAERVKKLKDRIERDMAKRIQLAYEETLETVEYCLKFLKFGDAVSALEKFKTDYPRSELVQRVAAEVRKVYEQAESNYRKLDEEAKRLIAEKKYKEAERIYREIIDNYGIEEYAQRAKKAMSEIPRENH